MKLPLGDLNPAPYLPHLINTYIYKVTIASRVHSGDKFFLNRRVSYFVDILS